MFTFRWIPLGKVWTPLWSHLCVKQYLYSSSRRMALALDNPRTLICHRTKKPILSNSARRNTVFALSWWKSVFPCWPTLVCPCVVVQRKTSLMVSLFTCLAYLFRVRIKLKLLTIVERDLNAPFSIAPTPRWGRRYPFPWIAPLYPWSVPYNAEY